MQLNLNLESERLERLTYDPLRYFFGKSPNLKLTALLSIGFLTLWYFAISSTIKERKRRAWILTLANSVVMTIGGSLCLVYLFISANHLSVVSESAIVVDTPLCRQVLMFFIVYCTLDLLIGFFQYGELMTFLFGWCHHVGYIALCGWVLKEHISLAFGIFAVLEAPTAILAAGQVKKEWRRDLSYGLTFFALRLAYHAFLLTRFYRFEIYSKLWVFVVLTLLLHLHWWRNWVKSFFFKKQSKLVKVDSHFD